MQEDSTYSVYSQGNDENYPPSDESTHHSKKRREKRKREESTRKITNRRIVNFPATQPYIRIVDGEERLCFKYNTKISESAMNTMPRQDLEDNEFCVRFDLDSVDVTKLNDKFKADNCVYPRANCDFEDYKGNRWHYETECNKLAWQFVSLNPVLLYGKKGLIQRAVDSYRNIHKDSKNRRMVSQDKIVNGVLKRRYSDLAPTTVSLFWNVKGNVRKVKVRVDIENVNYDKIDDEFKVKYSVYPDEFDDRSFGQEKWETSNGDNELAVKIAYLNVDNTSFWNAVKTTDRSYMLRKAVDAYKTMDVEYEEERTDFGEIVSNILDKAFDDTDDFLFLDSKPN